MEIIANNRANNREYIAFKDLKKAIFLYQPQMAMVHKNNDFYAVRLSDGETVEPILYFTLCEVKDCMLVEREIYTALTEKECNKCG